MPSSMTVIVILLIFFRYILKIWIFDEEPKEYTEEGKEANIWGKLILALIGMVAGLFIFFMFGAEGNEMKWFFIIIIIISMSYQTFLDLKYLDDSKQYLIPVILMFLGVTLVYFLF